MCNAYAVLKWLKFSVPHRRCFNVYLENYKQVHANDGNITGFLQSRELDRKYIYGSGIQCGIIIDMLEYIRLRWEVKNFMGIIADKCIVGGDTLPIYKIGDIPAKEREYACVLIAIDGPHSLEIFHNLYSCGFRNIIYPDDWPRINYVMRTYLSQKWMCSLYTPTQVVKFPNDEHFFGLIAVITA